MWGVLIIVMTQPFKRFEYNQIWYTILTVNYISNLLSKYKELGQQLWYKKKKND